MPPNDPGAYSPEELALLTQGGAPGAVPAGLPPEAAGPPPETLDGPDAIPPDGGAPTLDPAQAAAMMMQGYAAMMQQDQAEFQRQQEQVLQILPDIIAQVVQGLATAPETLDDPSLVPPEGALDEEPLPEEGPLPDEAGLPPEEIAALA